MSVQLRCRNRILFGELDCEDRILEVKCRSVRCGAGVGKVVLHHFDLITGKLLETKVFLDPQTKRKDVKEDG